MSTYNGIEIFIACEQADFDLKNELIRYLSPIQNKGAILSGSLAGEDMGSIVEKHLQNTTVIMVLLSADFLISDLYAIFEKALAQPAANPTKAKIIPVLLRDCLIDDTPFYALDILPARDKSATDPAWGNPAKAFTEIARGLRKFLDSMVLSQTLPTPATSTQPTSVAPKLTSSTGRFWGNDLHKLCNRLPQTQAFKVDFISTFRKQPKIYFIYGPEDQEHASLVDRLHIKVVKERLSKQFGLQESVVLEKNIAIPALTGLQRMTASFTLDLAEQLEVFDRNIDRAQVLLELPHLSNYKAVLLKHNLAYAYWQRDTLSFLKWYVGEFWNTTHTPNSPHFAVFINILGERRMPFIRSDIYRQVSELAEQFPNVCCMLDELTDISQQDVLLWLDEYDLDDFIDKTQLLNNIFQENEKVNMRVVERELKRNIENLQNQIQ